MAETHRPIAVQCRLPGVVERSERNLGGRECPLIGMTGNSVRTRLAYAAANCGFCSASPPMKVARQHGHGYQQLADRETGSRSRVRPYSGRPTLSSR
jgi:hypothetical protein